MSNKRITDLTELTNPTTDDVLPIVDIATNTTQKVQVGNLPTTTAVTNALATKQDTLVSGTNIKTLNSQSLLGNGNIVLTANPSGVAGAIQFSDGSAFASDAANLFWNNTTKRFGIGTNSPNTALDISASLTSILTLRNGATNFLTTRSSGIGGVDTGLRIWENSNNFTLDLYGSGSYDHPQRHRFYVGGAAGERLLVGSSTAVTIKGSGSTSATTSLLVQNSASSELLRVRDDGFVLMSSNAQVNGNLECASTMFTFRLWGRGAGNLNLGTNGFGDAMTFTSATGDATITTSLTLNSTTKGFLPPRMTTTQKNAIASPAAGLVVYDNTTNKLQCYNGSTWNDLF